MDKLMATVFLADMNDYDGESAGCLPTGTLDTVLSHLQEDQLMHFSYERRIRRGKSRPTQTGSSSSSSPSSPPRGWIPQHAGPPITVPI